MSLVNAVSPIGRCLSSLARTPNSFRLVKRLTLGNDVSLLWRIYMSTNNNDNQKQRYVHEEFPSLSSSQCHLAPTLDCFSITIYVLNLRIKFIAKKHQTQSSLSNVNRCSDGRSLSSFASRDSLQSDVSDSMPSGMTRNALSDNPRSVRQVRVRRLWVDVNAFWLN